MSIFRSKNTQPEDIAEIEEQIQKLKADNKRAINKTTREIKATTVVIKREDITAILFEAIHGSNK